MMTAARTHLLLSLFAISVAMFSPLPAQAHQAAERFIPIGQSPGVSHNLTIVGKIETVDTQRRSVTIVTPSGKSVVQIRKEAKIWIDRSKLKQTSLVGGFDDLKPVRTVEVKFVDPDHRRDVDWVKVEDPLPR